MILANIFIQIAIILGLVIVFILLFLLNKKIKAPADTENEKCQTCLSETCIIKTKDISKIKEEMKKEIEKCDLGGKNEK